MIGEKKREEGLDGERETGRGTRTESPALQGPVPDGGDAGQRADQHSPGPEDPQVRRNQNLVLK